QRRGAEAVHRRAGHALRQPGQKRGPARKVHPLLLLWEAEADHHVDDVVRVESLGLLDRLPNREREQVVGADVHERALASPPDRGADGADDDGLGHSVAPYVKALDAFRARPTMRVWIWLVPSYRLVTRASRRYFATGY